MSRSLPGGHSRSEIPGPSARAAVPRRTMLWSVGAADVTPVRLPERSLTMKPAPALPQDERFTYPPHPFAGLRGRVSGIHWHRLAGHDRDQALGPPVLRDIHLYRGAPASGRRETFTPLLWARVGVPDANHGPAF